jgi:hypothetical protein
MVVMRNTTPNVRKALDKLDDLARTVDASPVSLVSLGDRWGTRIFYARKKAALKDERWAAEENARKVEGGGSTLHKPGTDLTVDSFFVHLDEMDSLAPRPWYAKVARTMEEARLSKATSGLLEGFDKLTRGFTDREVWSLTGALATRAGGQLLALADMANGWPSDEYEAFEDWVAVLRKHGNSLTSYGRQDGVSELLNAWAEVPGGSDEREKARVAQNAREAELSKGAREAYQWIAEHHGQLWD